MRLEFHGGASRKFWQIAQSGKVLHIRWGRIGTEGQGQDRSFESAAKAKDALEKLVSSKEQKGYAPVGKTKAGVRESRSPEAFASVKPALGRLPRALRRPLAEWKVAADGPARTVTKKELTVSWGHTVLAGGLTVTGSLDFRGALVVLGDLEVGRAIELSSGTDALVVGGSVKAKGVFCRNHVDVQGALKTEVLFVESAGMVRAEGGITADLIILEDPTSKIVGSCKAKRCIVLDYPDPKPLAQLRKVLGKNAFSEVDWIGCEGIFDCTKLMGAIRRGRPWRA